jgi:hypothetical protein
MVEAERMSQGIAGRIVCTHLLFHPIHLLRFDGSELKAENINDRLQQTTCRSLIVRVGQQLAQTNGMVASSGLWNIAMSTLAL